MALVSATDLQTNGTNFEPRLRMAGPDVYAAIPFLRVCFAFESCTASSLSGRGGIYSAIDEALWRDKELGRSEDSTSNHVMNAFQAHPPPPPRHPLVVHRVNSESLRPQTSAPSTTRTTLTP